jgi:hypothetical protein
VAAGTGNSFNRRAGVSGAGLIVAGANAAQAITGASVSGGSTPNATLTINNVRVGATSFDYQIANTGPTGPIAARRDPDQCQRRQSLRCNRLGGAGVTARQLQRRVRRCANSGNLSVTFTAAAAGALAPASRARC